MAPWRRVPAAAPLPRQQLDSWPATRQAAGTPGQCRLHYTTEYRLSIYRGHIWLDSAHSSTITIVKPQSDLALTIETPYLNLTGELWGVFRELFKEKWPRYIESALYSICSWYRMVTYLQESYGLSYVTSLDWIEFFFNDDTPWRTCFR